jgi:hypothetical protein
MDREQEAQIREKHANAHEIRIEPNKDGSFTVSVLTGHRKRRHAEWHKVIVPGPTDEMKKKRQKELAAQIFGLTIFLNDDFLTFKNPNPKPDIERYLRILMRLNMDLQRVTALRTVGDPSTFIPHQDSEKAFRVISRMGIHTESVSQPLLYTDIFEGPQRKNAAVVGRVERQRNPSKGFI